jgi:thiosulfate reductase cytochrome b subunit
MEGLSERAATRVPRHRRAVRLTHWVNALAFAALLISGLMILTAHPRFYWGETGFFDTPAAFELPMKPILEDLWVRAYGRNVHFLMAWAAVLNGLFYAAWGILTGHFRSRFLPARRELAWTSVKQVLMTHLRFHNPSSPSGYNLLQKLAYAFVVFALLPLLILSGLTMSPAVTAAFPQLFTLFGGRQSARTIHFLLGVALSGFAAVHVFMVYLSGFRTTTAQMIWGEPQSHKEESE